MARRRRSCFCGNSERAESARRPRARPMNSWISGLSCERSQASPVRQPSIPSTTRMATSLRANARAAELDMIITPAPEAATSMAVRSARASCIPVLGVST